MLNYKYFNKWNNIDRVGNYANVTCWVRMARHEWLGFLVLLAQRIVSNLKMEPPAEMKLFHCRTISHWNTLFHAEIISLQHETSIWNKDVRVLLPWRQQHVIQRACALHTSWHSPYPFTSMWHHTTLTLWWLFGAVGSDIGQINEVTLRRTRLVLGWVTVSGFNSWCEKFISV